MFATLSADKQTAVARSAIQAGLAKAAADADDMDDYTLSYVADALVEGLAKEKWCSAEEIHGGLAELLTTYGACQTEDDAVPVCEAIYNFLLQSSHISAQSTAKVPATTSTTSIGATPMLAQAVTIAHDAEDVASEDEKEASGASEDSEHQDGDQQSDDENEEEANGATRTASSKKLNRKSKQQKNAISDKAKREMRLAEEEKLEREAFTEHSILLERGRFPKGMKKDVYIKDVMLTTVTGEELLTSGTLHFEHGHRYGMVGRNGAGKTTLLRRMHRRQIRGMPKYLHTLLVTQEVVGSQMSVLETVLASDSERMQLKQEEDKLLQIINASSEADEKYTERLNQVYARLEQIDADSAESRAIQVLNGLQFTSQMQQKPTVLLSGGWRMRVALACALFLEPDILMLDEPTNHLDLHAVFWLQDYLSTYEGTVIVVSHDREFLNAVATDIVHFHHKKLDYYTGNYDGFVKTREEKLTHKRHVQEGLDRTRKHMQATIDRIEKAAKTKKGDQKKLKQVTSRRKKLERHGQETLDDGRKFKLQEHAIREGSVFANGGGWVNRKMTAGSLIEKPEKAIKFSFPAPESLGVYGSVLQLKRVWFSYDVNASDALQAEHMTQAMASLGPTISLSSVAPGLDSDTPSLFVAGPEASTTFAPTARTVSSAATRSAAASTSTTVTTTTNSAPAKANAASVVKSSTPGVIDFTDEKFQTEVESSAEMTALKQQIKSSQFGLCDVTMDISVSSRIAILGRNGAGKSTLLKLIKGDVQPVLGEIFRHHNLRLAYFTQHHINQLDLSLTAIEHLQHHFPQKKELELRAHLGTFGFTGSLPLQTMATLSGGQKSRVVFATITMHNPQILVLDEPTNHLDFDTIDAFIQAINEFAGGIIVVSHDQGLISRVCKELWVVERGTVSKFEGSFAAYREHVISTLNY